VRAVPKFPDMTLLSDIADVKSCLKPFVAKNVTTSEEGISRQMISLKTHFMDGQFDRALL